MCKKLFLLLIFCQSLLFPQKDRDSILGFRGIKWGVSAVQVKQMEQALYMQESKGLGFSVLSFRGDIAGLPARIDYTFRNDSLAEASYSIQKVDSFSQKISAVRNFFSDLYGRADYANINAFDSDSLWTIENPGILYNGPQYFWEFANGFICQYSSKFIPSSGREEITITILYVPYTKISDYSESRLIPLDDLNFPKSLWNWADP
jgi:hypothetical protein